MKEIDMGCKKRQWRLWIYRERRPWTPEDRRKAAARSGGRGGRGFGRKGTHV